MPPSPRLEWKLKTLLEREKVTVYALSKKFEEVESISLHRNTLYRWANQAPDRPSLEGIAWVLWGLGELTGKTYSITDVLEYRNATATSS